MTVFKTWQESWRLIRKHPVVFAPFVIAAGCSLIALYILFLAPQRPLSYLLAPPIRAVAGEKFLHYPFNFIILPKLFRLGDLFVGALVGMLMSAVGVGIVAEGLTGKRPSFLINFIVAGKRYFALVAVWLISFGAITLAMKLIPQMFDSRFVIVKAFFVAISLGLSILIQAMFIYTVPVLILERQKLIPALRENFRMVLKYFLPTLILVLIPALVYVPVLLLKSYAVAFVHTTFPETVLIILGAGIVVTFFIDVWVTVSITTFFLKKRNR